MTVAGGSNRSFYWGPMTIEITFQTEIQDQELQNRWLKTENLESLHPYRGYKRVEERNTFEEDLWRAFLGRVGSNPKKLPKGVVTPSLQIEKGASKAPTLSLGDTVASCMTFPEKCRRWEMDCLGALSWGAKERLLCMGLTALAELLGQIMGVAARDSWCGVSLSPIRKGSWRSTLTSADRSQKYTWISQSWRRNKPPAGVEMHSAGGQSIVLEHF